MENIGAILKERRQQLNYTLEEMSAQTKLSIVQLQAIERGDIQFFKDDLSYLSYFVRYYANALGIDYNEIRNQLDDSINQYTDTVSLSKIRKQEEINERVLTQAKRGAKARRKIDFSSIILVGVVIVIGALLVVAWQKVIWPGLQAKDPINPPVIVVPDEEKPEDEGEEKPEEKPEDVAKLDVKTVDPFHYEITGWKEGDELTFDLKVVNRTWVRFSENGVVLDAPAQGIYETDQDVKVILKAEKDKVLSANIGYVKGNIITLNEEKIELAPEAGESQSGLVLEFKLVEGEVTE
ncbi:RodZ family helix-turn-helix domain-containing protein [Erysipelothrix urinaevulpis]|uniref:helix-turn-helix domain-containing protein n=1 Tax=Erysipelothrix urinaevulpis TaxID=2683717 RepID=UPI00135871DF|nr:helix-turn-helix transcriptional regulator [Erysipelothrix urinaevulpis]